jgi:hypothetical protein
VLVDLGGSRGLGLVLPEKVTNTSGEATRELGTLVLLFFLFLLLSQSSVMRIRG